MKKNSIIALLLVLAMSLALAACGGTASTAGEKPQATSAAQETPEYVYVSEFDDFMTEMKNYLDARAFTDDGFYATSYEKVSEEIPEGVTPEYQGEYDVYQSFLYFVSNDGSMRKLENYVPLEPDTNDNDYQDFNSSCDLNGVCLSPDGSLVTIECLYTSWYEGPEGLTRYDNEYWNNQKYSQRYFIRWLGSDGAEKSCAEIEVPQDSYLDAYRMVLDNKGNVLVPFGSGLRAIGPDGSDSYVIETNGGVDSVLELADGSLAISHWSDETQQQELATIDTDAGTMGEGIPMNFDSYSAVKGNDDYDLFYTSGTNFYGFNIGDEAPTKLFNWLSCDVNGNTVSDINVTDDGVITGYVNDWDQNYETYDLERVTITKAPYDSVPHKESITMAVVSGLDYNVLEKIVDFNRSNDKYRIEVTDYSEYNNEKDGWDAGQTKLNTEIMAGDVPDIFSLAGLNYSQLAAKGILEDLYPYIDSDKDFDRDDFFQNILGAMEVEGKLCTTVSNYYISTVVGASSKVGDEPGWTYDEFDAALASMPEDCDPFDVYVTRTDMLQNCLALDMNDFVNWATGECSFDSQQFIDLLEFANQFPAEFDWNTYDNSEENDTMARLSSGRQMLVQTSMYSIQDIFYNNYAQYLGGKVTYVGFPTLNGTGNMLGMTDGGYGMSSKSEYKDVIWQFMREFFTEDYQKSMYSLPSNKNAFESMAKDAATVTYMKDAEGNELLDDDGEKIPVAKFSLYNQETGEYEEYYAMTDEQIAQVRELVNTTTKVADYNSSIFDIVSEQVSAYFEGQKSAEDVAKLIQSKANIYVNEQR